MFRMDKLTTKSQEALETAFSIAKEHSHQQMLGADKIIF